MVVNLLAILLLLAACVGSWVALAAYVPSDWLAWSRVGMVGKLVLGLLVGYLYATVWGGGDTWQLHASGLELLALAKADPIAFLQVPMMGAPSPDYLFHSEPRALFMAWLLVAPLVLSAQQYYLAAIWVSLLGFWGLVFGLASLKKLGWIQGKALLVGVFLWPSVAFWSAGIMKETLVLGLVGMVVGATCSWLLGGKRSWLLVLVAAVCLVVLWQLKYYVAGLLFATLAAAVVGHWCKQRGVSRLWWVYSSVWVGGLLLATLTYPALHPQHILSALHENYEVFHNTSQSPQVVYYPQWDGTLTGALLSVPKVFSVGMFLPLTADAWNVWSFLAGLENLMWMTLFVLVVLRLIRGYQGMFKVQLEPYQVSALLFVVIALILIGLATPNLGTLLRYRVVYLPLAVAWVLSQLGVK